GLLVQGNTGIGAVTTPGNTLEVNKNIGPRALKSGLRLTDLAGWECPPVNLAGIPASNGVVLSVDCFGDVIIQHDCCWVEGGVAPPSNDLNQKLEQQNIEIQNLKDRVSRLESFVQT